MKIRCGRSLERWLVATEDACRMRAEQRDGSVLNAQRRTFAQAYDRGIVFFEELQDTFFLGFAHVSGRRIGVEVVRADLKSNEAERVEGGRLDDRHVFGGPQRRASHDGTGARSDERHTSGHAVTDGLEKFVVVKTFQQAEGVAAADKDSVCLLDSALDI